MHRRPMFSHRWHMVWPLHLIFRFLHSLLSMYIVNRCYAAVFLSVSGRESVTYQATEVYFSRFCLCCRESDMESSFDLLRVELELRSSMVELVSREGGRGEGESEWKGEGK
jgi:hypothetical protein